MTVIVIRSNNLQYTKRTAFNKTVLLRLLYALFVQKNSFQAWLDVVNERIFFDGMLYGSLLYILPYINCPKMLYHKFQVKVISTKSCWMYSFVKFSIWWAAHLYWHAIVHAHDDEIDFFGVSCHKMIKLKMHKNLNIILCWSLSTFLRFLTWIMYF